MYGQASNLLCKFLIPTLQLMLTCSRLCSAELPNLLLDDALKILQLFLIMKKAILAVLGLVVLGTRYWVVLGLEKSYMLKNKLTACS